ncbi:MAG: hypothetical protein AAGF11_49510 [Myxococcota bacterium]
MIGGFVLEGRYTSATLRSMAILLIALPFGLLAGELIHRRVAERPFKPEFRHRMPRRRTRRHRTPRHRTHCPVGLY